MANYCPLVFDSAIAFVQWSLINSILHYCPFLYFFIPLSSHLIFMEVKYTRDGLCILKIARFGLEVKKIDVVLDIPPKSKMATKALEVNELRNLDSPSTDI